VCYCIERRVCAGRLSPAMACILAAHLTGDGNNIELTPACLAPRRLHTHRILLLLLSISAAAAAAART
jgi:hypothetical protein